MARLAISAAPSDAVLAPSAIVAEHARRSAAYEWLCTAIQAATSAMALVLLSPLFAAIAICIKASSRGPVFYRGTRVGADLRPFTIYKFRTMLEGTESQVGARLLTNEQKDRFCTPVGRILKRTKLDELPQLVNVLKGEMRLVGPRPVRPVFIDALVREVPCYALRFLVPPGVTGIAQLRGGYYTSPRNKLRYDLAYIRNRSLLLDFRVLVLTVVKVMDRWLSMGLFALFIYFFVSFVPVRLHDLAPIPLLPVKPEVVSLLLIAMSVWVFMNVRAARFSLYRCPINVPILLFLALNLVSTALAEHPSLALRGSAYYAVTGFLTAFVIVNTLATAVFVKWTVRVIALTSSVISLLGLFRTFASNAASAPAPAGARPVLEAVSSMFYSPVELAVYLVLGMPLLLAQITSAREVRHRDFWIVCATISFVGVFLTQTRVGLLALLFTGGLFLYRRRAGILAFVTVFVVGILLLVSLGLPRFTVPDIAEDLSRRLDEGRALFHRPPMQWLIGVGAAGTAELLAAGSGAPAALARETPGPSPNMHVTLVVEHGILGWLIVMWIVLATIAALCWAHHRAKDEEVKTLLWAIVCSLAGYLISMASMNTFHHLPIQVFFWSLIGIGLGLATRVRSRRRHNVIWRFGDAGD
jgi:lipopolysaccharide/colanic/teichoic acid biosynthesis glycosyltransferase